MLCLIPIPKYGGIGVTSAVAVGVTVGFAVGDGGYVGTRQGVSSGSVGFGVTVTYTSSVICGVGCGAGVRLQPEIKTVININENTVQINLLRFIWVLISFNLKLNSMHRSKTHRSEIVILRKKANCTICI